MSENGLERFYHSIARFRGRINFKVEKENSDRLRDKILTNTVDVEQLSAFFVLYAFHNIIAIAVFIVEWIGHEKHDSQLEKHDSLQIHCTISIV